MAKSLREFLRTKGADTIKVKKTSVQGFDGMEFGKEGQPTIGICFFSKALREEGIPSEAHLAAHLDDYSVYDTVTSSGAVGYTLGKPEGEFTLQGGTTVSL